MRCSFRFVSNVWKINSPKRLLAAATAEAATMRQAGNVRGNSRVRTRDPVHIDSLQGVLWNQGLAELTHCYLRRYRPRSHASSNPAFGRRAEGSGESRAACPVRPLMGHYAFGFASNVRNGSRR